MKKRTDMDFSGHELIVEEHGPWISHELKKPKTRVNSVQFINCGVLAITGDYGNWIFNREFRPSPEKDCFVSDQYWIEKLKIASTQDPYHFDAGVLSKQVDDLLIQFKGDFNQEEEDWLNKLRASGSFGGECAYIATAMDRPASFEVELIPKGKRMDYWLELIFDAYDEIINRLILEKELK